MFIAKVDNGNITVADYRELFPNTSFGVNGPDSTFLQENNCLTVTVFKAHDNKTQKLVPSEPYIEDNQVFTVVVENKTQEELTVASNSEAAQIRSRRNALLSSSDWTQLADSTADKASWAVYRQALRDISSQAGFPWIINWPLNPDEQLKETINGN